MIQKIALLIVGMLGFVSLSNLVQTKSIQAMEHTDSPIVLEMFTSQSCSSCPPADRVLSQLEAQNDNIIALSCHVTYWNHLHWEDTLSKEFCSTRQRDYVRTLRSRGPYTPQIMINGKHTMVGSQGGKIVRAIENAAPIKSIGLSLDNDQLNIKLPETAGNDSYALNLVIYKDAHKQSIPSCLLYTSPSPRDRG